MKLGKVIGTRTWGGVVGIRGDKQFVDSGMTHPCPSSLGGDARRGWNLENEGVTPDIIVPMTPEDEIANRDPQLDRAIAELQQDLAENKYARPERRPSPTPWRTGNAARALHDQTVAEKVRREKSEVGKA
jgi:tricorn protease